MPYTSIHWIKLEVRLLNDHRFYLLDEFSQLLFVKLLLISGVTTNEIPKEANILKSILRSDQSESKIEESIIKIKQNFPSFKENKGFYYFDDWNTKHNWVILGNSQGTPKEVLEEEEEKKKNKNKNKKEKKKKKENLPTKSELINKYKSKYPKLDLEEEWDKFIAYNAEVREKPLKSISLGWINWLKNAEKFRLTSPEGIRERELEQERKKGEELKNKKGSPMPESLRKQRDDLLKKVSR